MKVYVHPATQLRIEAVIAHPGGTVLLHGQPGVGRRTLALEIARRLNCQGCKDNSCRSCKMVAGGNHPDVIVVTPDEKGKIGIEAVHELQQKLTYRPYEGESQRVVIISNADTLTLPAQNAILKTLEEPPGGTTIILTATGPAGLLPTVISRCTTLYVPPISSSEVEAAIHEVVPNAANVPDIAIRARGRVGLALRYAADPSSQEADNKAAQQIGVLLGQQDLYEGLILSEQLAKDFTPALLNELTAQATAAAQTGDTVPLAAVERLHERLRANVVPKTAFTALAVELAC